MRTREMPGRDQFSGLANISSQILEEMKRLEKYKKSKGKCAKCGKNSMTLYRLKKNDMCLLCLRKEID